MAADQTRDTVDFLPEVAAGDKQFWRDTFIRGSWRFWEPPRDGRDSDLDSKIERARPLALLGRYDKALGYTRICREFSFCRSS